MSTLKQKAISAVIWSASERLSGQVIRFVIGVILARLLMPAEFGLIGMLVVFMGVSQVFVNCGFGEALIQKQNASRCDESSVFYVNVALGTIAAVMIYVGAPEIANFYHQPMLVWLARIMALDVLISSFGVVQTMLLTKELDFKTQIKISIVSTVISGVISITMAAKGFGVLSLAAQILVGDLLRTVLLWALHDWRPSFTLSFTSLREMFPYGSRLFASGLLDSAFAEIYAVVIGRIYPAAMLGLYTRARQLQQLPVDNLCSIVGRVSFPVFASIQHDKVALKRAVRRSLKGLAWLNFPAMVGLAIIARPLVVVLLTQKWIACVPYIQLLCINGAFYPLSLIHVNALSAQGRSDLFLRVEVFKKLLAAAGVAASFKFGVTGLLVGNIVVGIISYGLNSFYSSRLIDYSWREQLFDLLPYLGMSMLMGAAVWAVSKTPFRWDLAQFILQVISGGVVYGTSSWFWRVSSFTEAREALIHRLPRWNAA